MKIFMIQLLKIVLWQEKLELQDSFIVEEVLL